ncbi:MAG: hypothetical protein ACI8PZ_004145 [Myxococcota bacterium]
MVGDFDADGDGRTDVAFGGYYQQLVVHYGPFEGVRPGTGSPDFDATQVTSFRTLGCLEGFMQTWNLGALAGPGSAVLAVGEDRSYSCREQIQVVDMAGPRGRSLTPDDRLAWGDGAEYLVPLGDWNDDGHADLHVSHASLRAGPFDGSIVLNHPFYVDHMPYIQMKMVRLVQDLTGDGKPELLVTTSLDDDRPYLVPSLIPADAVVHVPTVGTRLDSPDGMTPWIGPYATGDFDGDGLGDFAFGRRSADDDAGAIYVWFGKDVVFPEG